MNEFIHFVIIFCLFDQVLASSTYLWCMTVWERMCNWERESKESGINSHFVAIFFAAWNSFEHLYGTSQYNVALCATAHRSSRNLISHSRSTLECMLGWNDELESTYISTPAHPLHTSQLSGAVTGSVLSAFHVLLSPHKVFFHCSA